MSTHPGPLPAAQTCTNVLPFAPQVGHTVGTGAGGADIEGYLSHLEALAQGHARLAAAVSETRRELDAALAADDAAASLHMRPLGSRMAWLQWATAMTADGTDPQLVEHFIDRRLGPAAPRDTAYLERLELLSREP